MSAALRDVVARARDAGITIHSLAVSVDGELVTESALPPFANDAPHRFYSVAKSMTALAVLIQVDRGLLSLDDPICAHFPEFDDVHPWIASTRVDDVLAMTGPHPRTTFDGADWLGSYFRALPTQPPATLFTYDTSGSYVLSALVERVAGMPLVDVLRRDLLDPLGVGATARMLTGPEGIGHGGSGLIIPPADMLAVAETINGRGRRHGAQIVPPAVVQSFIERRADTAMLPWSRTFRAGYGRQVWLPGDGTWLMFGLGGQLVYGDPSRAIAAVVTADTTSLAGGDQWLADEIILALSRGDHSEVPLDPTRPGHRAANARPIEGTWRLVGGEGAPEVVEVTGDASGGRIRCGAGAPQPFTCGVAVTTASALGPAVIASGWSAPGVLDIRMSAAGDDIATVTLRIVVTADGRITLESKAFGPETAWSWRGSYRATTVAAG